MAYADYSFYKQKYFGTVIRESESGKWLEKASDVLDWLTFGRLSFAFPTVEAHAKKVKKAVCAIAEALYNIDVQRTAMTAKKAEDGEILPAVSSVSSGRESVSYSNATTSSVYALAASNQSEFQKLLAQITLTYLAGIPDANGINLLYGGIGNV